MLASLLLVILAPVVLVLVALALASLRERAPRRAFVWRFLTHTHDVALRGSEGE